MRDLGRWTCRGCCLFIVVLVSIACKTGPQLPSEERALLAGQRTIQAGVQRGISTTEALPRVKVRVRHNPVACDAPEFEVYTHQRWRRVYIDSPRELQGQLQSFKERSAANDALGFLEVEGAYGGTRRAPSGARYPVFALVAVQ